MARKGNQTLSDHFQQGFANRLGQRAANRVRMRPTPMEQGRRAAVATSPALAAGQARRLGPTMAPNMVAAMMARRRAMMGAPTRVAVAVRPPVARPRVAARPALPPFGGLPQRRGY